MCPDRLRDRLPCISHGIFRNGYRSKHQRASCLRHLIVVSPRRIVRICAGKHFSTKLILTFVEIVRAITYLLVQFEGIILRKSASGSEHAATAKRAIAQNKIFDIIFFMSFRF